MKIVIPVTVNVDPNRWREVMNGDLSNRDGKGGYSLASVREDIIEYVFNQLDGASLIEETGAGLVIHGTTYKRTRKD